MKFIPWIISAYLLGYLVFTTAALFGIYHEWDMAWFIWNNVCNAGILVWVALYFLVPLHYRKAIKWVCVFGVTVPIWQTSAVIAGISWNNDIAVMAELLVLLSVYAHFMFCLFNQHERLLLPTKK